MITALAALISAIVGFLVGRSVGVQAGEAEIAKVKAGLLSDIQSLREEGNRAIEAAYEKGLEAGSEFPTRAPRQKHAPLTSDDFRTPNHVNSTTYEHSLKLLLGLAPKQIEICFTGWMDDEKAKLKDAASAAGWRVRTTVTQQLLFLCCGPYAGPEKVKKARHQGVVIIDDGVFRRLAEEVKRS